MVWGKSWIFARRCNLVFIRNTSRVSFADVSRDRCVKLNTNRTLPLGAWRAPILTTTRHTPGRTPGPNRNRRVTPRRSHPDAGSGTRTSRHHRRITSHRTTSPNTSAVNAPSLAQPPRHPDRPIRYRRCSQLIHVRGEASVVVCSSPTRARRRVKIARERVSRVDSTRASRGAHVRFYLGWRSYTARLRRCFLLHALTRSDHARHPCCLGSRERGTSMGNLIAHAVCGDRCGCGCALLDRCAPWRLASARLCSGALALTSCEPSQCELGRCESETMSLTASLCGGRRAPGCAGVDGRVQALPSAPTSGPTALPVQCGGAPRARPAPSSECE